jgi:hypothetical protein
MMDIGGVEHHRAGWSSITRRGFSVGAGRVRRRERELPTGGGIQRWKIKINKEVKELPTLPRKQNMTKEEKESRSLSLSLLRWWLM